MPYKKCTRLNFETLRKQCWRPNLCENSQMGRKTIDNQSVTQNITSSTQIGLMIIRLFNVEIDSVPLLNAQLLVWMPCPTGLWRWPSEPTGDDALYKTLTARWTLLLSTGLNLKPFNGNRDVTSHLIIEKFKRLTINTRKKQKSTEKPNLTSISLFMK